VVFEARPKPGGMMRYGIPYYRLPEDILDEEIHRVLSVGIELHTEKKLGRDFDLNSLEEDGFEAIFVGTGLQESSKIDLEGAQSGDVFWGVDFLADIGEGKAVTLKDRVLVVGGGNVAIDVGLTALRVGAKEVTLACLESREEMPANPWEIDMALEEGIRLMTSRGPKRIIGDNGNVKGVELIQCTSVFDEAGNFSPAFGDLTEEVEADQVVLAIGQSADLSFVEKNEALKVENGLIAIDEETMETGMPGVFAGGDVGRGPGAIIDAIAAGRKAVNSIDIFLGGDGNIKEALAQPSAPSEPYTGKRERGFADQTRVETPTLPLGERHKGFSEVDLCFSDEQAIFEAKRCLQCDLEKALAEEARLQRQA